MRILPLHIDPVFLLVGIIVGLRYGVLLHGRGVRLSGRLEMGQAPVLVVSALLFIFGNTFLFFGMNKPAIAWYFPFFIEYYYESFLTAVNFTFLSFCAAVMAALVYRTSKLQALIAVLIGCLVVGGAEVYTRAIRAGQEIALREPRITGDGVVLQTCGSSCAAATGANIARHFGIEKSEREMAALMGTTETGTSNAQIAHALYGIGLAVRKHYEPGRAIDKIKAPAVLVVDLVNQPEGHAVAFMGMHEGKAEIWDPGSGKHFETPEELARRWRGRALEVSPLEKRR